MEHTSCKSSKWRRGNSHQVCQTKSQCYMQEPSLYRRAMENISIRGIINGRPLYPSSNDIWESPPITPNDILIGDHLPLPQPEPEERINPRHRLRSTQDRVNEFWECWMRYFAPNLLPRNKWFRTRENVHVDDLVLELDQNHKRSQWKLARIIVTYPGKDGLVRKARIKTQDGEYDKPIHKLCLLATKEELNAEFS